MQYLFNICSIAGSNWSLKTFLTMIICCHCFIACKKKLSAYRSLWSNLFSNNSGLELLAGSPTLKTPSLLTLKSSLNTRLTITPMPAGWTNPDSSLLLQISRQAESSLISTSIRLIMSKPKLTWGRWTQYTRQTSDERLSFTQPQD